MTPGPDERPLVSVIIPCFNAAATVCCAVDSALAQENVSVEVLLSDDGSQDDTLHVLREVYGQHPGVRVLQAETNRGPSAARNRALAVARGDWIAVLDADDYMLPDRFGRLLVIARENNSDIVFDAYNLCSPDSGEVVATRGLAPGESVSGARLILDNIGSCKPMFARDVLRRGDLYYREEYRYGEDIELLIRLFHAGYSCSYCPEAHYHKIEAASSLTASRIDMLSGVRELFLQLREIYGQGDKALNSALGKALIWQADALYCNQFRQDYKQGGLTMLLVETGKHPLKALASLRHVFLRRRRFREQRVAPAKRLT